MRTTVRLLFAFVLLAAVGLPRPGHADMSSADQTAIRGMISAQIQAFQNDDGATAYGLASPTIHQLFPNVDQFMGMVRNGYQPVYRPKSVTFGPIAETPTGALQKVFLVGPDGKNWVALYSLQRQPDGSWLIGGCTLLEDTGATI